MDMENLNKSQIILLTLLVSFVTSIATGIVTVTLLDQAPPGVTRTINRIVERTIETVVPGENQVTTITKEIVTKEEDLIPDAVERSSKSLVEVKAVNSEGDKVDLGLGVVISSDGYFITDKKRISGNRNNLIAEYAGATMSAVVVSEDEDEFAVLKMSLLDTVLPAEDLEKGDPIDEMGEESNDDKEVKMPVFTPASLSDSNDVRLGQKVLAFDGVNGVKIGIISNVKKVFIKQDLNDTSEDDIEDIDSGAVETGYITTDIILDKKNIGSPLVSTNGDMLGLVIASPEYSGMIVIPVNRVKDVFFEITKPEEKDTEKIEGETTTEG